jgi:hypothetical protein
MAKKYMLEKYIKSKEIDTFTDTDTHRDTCANIYYRVYDTQPIFQESELSSLVIHNSILRYQNIKLIKENTQLQHKLKEKRMCDTMHWEIIEEIKFCEWLHDKQDLEHPARKCNENSNKRKSNEGVTVTHTQIHTQTQTHTHTHTQTHTQVRKKVKVSAVSSIQSIQSTQPPTPYQKREEKEKDVIVIYDTDETETDEELS